MSEADETERAILYQRQQEAQAAYRKQAHAQLVAPGSTRQALEARWEAVRLWLAERRER